MAIPLVVSEPISDKSPVPRIVSPAEAAKIAEAYAVEKAGAERVSAYLASPGFFAGDSKFGSIVGDVKPSAPPARFGFTSIDEPCWLVSVPYFDGNDGWCLRSTRVIVVARVGGRVLNDCSLMDEG